MTMLIGTFWTKFLGEWILGANGEVGSFFVFVQPPSLC